MKNFNFPIMQYQSTNFFKAFILYAIVGSLIASLAVHFRLEINNNKGIGKQIGNWIDEKLGVDDIEKGTILNFILSFVLTLVITLIIYHLMFFMFGWGGGMLINKNNIIKKKYF